MEEGGMEGERGKGGREIGKKRQREWWKEG